MAGIIGIPGRLRLEWVAAFARNPRPTSSEYAPGLLPCPNFINILVALGKVVAFLLIMGALLAIMNVILSLIFWKKERDPRISPFWRKIGRREDPKN